VADSVRTRATTSLDPVHTTMLQATSVVAQSPSGSVAVAAIVAVDVVEPCPDSDFSPSGLGDMQTEVARLEPMLGQVLAYGSEHSAEFGNYGLVWHSDGDASVVISFTNDLEAHRTALRSDVAYPNELIVCQVAISGTVAQALSTTLVDELAGRFSSIGQGIGPIDMILNEGENALADQLAAQYGDAVRVTVCTDDASCTIAVEE